MLRNSGFSKIADATKIIELQEKLLSKQEKDVAKISDVQEKLALKKDDEIWNCEKCSSERDEDLFVSV